jgi:hypothetical protein
MRTKIALAFLAVCAAGTTASATPTTYEFQLSNVRICGTTVSSTCTTSPTNNIHGTLTGTFTYNSTLNTLVSADITSSASSYTYIYNDPSAGTTNVTLSISNATSFELTSSLTHNTDAIYVTFASALTTSGATITDSTSHSYEHDSFGNPSLSGSIIAYVPAATPEPSAIALLGTGLLGIAGLVRRRIRV